MAPDIRRATLQDVDRLAQMGLDFIEASGRPDGTIEGCRDFCRSLLSRDDGAAFLSPRGCIAGMISPVYYAPETTCAVELWWRADDGCGLKLLTAFEEWAESRGADFIQGSAIIGHSPPVVSKLWQRRGYLPNETSFVKVL